MRCHIVSSCHCHRLWCSEPLCRRLISSAKSRRRQRHILPDSQPASQAVSPELFCLLSPTFVCGQCVWGRRQLFRCLHFYLYFIFNWLTESVARLPGGYLGAKFRYALCVLQSIHQSYLLFNELISFNLFAQVSVAITDKQGEPCSS